MTESVKNVCAAKRRGDTPITHNMNLNPEPFEMIKNGRKTIEMRLNDERRKEMLIGDRILFAHTETGEKLTVRIIDRYVYKNFDELYAHHDKTTIGYTEDEVADPRDMLKYYTEENIEKYGALGIAVVLE